MTDTCQTPLSREELLDYLSGGSEPEDDERLESHLFVCASCASEAEQLAGLITAVAHTVPPVLSATRFAALQQQGRVGATNPMSPGQAVDVFYPEPDRLLVHRLGGANLSGAERIDLDLSDSSGKSFLHLENIPFDPARGEVLVACQHHFAEMFPRDVVFSVESVAGDHREEVARYTVYHQLP